MRGVRVGEVQPESVSLYAYIFDRLGTVRGVYAVPVVWQWLFATARRGAVPSLTEYAKFWMCGRRTAARHAAVMVEVFGDDWRTAIGELVPRWSDQLTGPRALGGLMVASVGVSSTVARRRTG